MVTQVAIQCIIWIYALKICLTRTIDYSDCEGDTVLSWVSSHKVLSDRLKNNKRKKNNKIGHYSNKGAQQLRRFRLQTKAKGKNPSYCMKLVLLFWF